MNEFANNGGLSVGDRLQNFMRYDQHAKPTVVYQDFCGVPLVLLVAAGPQAPDQIQAFGRTELPGNARAAALIAGEPDNAKRVAESNQVDYTILADDGGIVGYLLGGNPTEPEALVFDGNMRLAGRRRLSQCEQDNLAQWAAQCLSSLPGVDERVITSVAPALVIPRVMGEAYCQKLIRYFEESGSYESGVYIMQKGELVFTPDPEVKVRRDHTIEDPALGREIQTLLMRRVVPEIQWAFAFKVTRFEQFKLIRYSADTGGYFRPHRDNDSPDTAHRRFALTLNLNTGDYDGGELRFPEYGPERYQAPRGGAVVFSCNLAHEALDVTRGDRYALLSFFYGEEQERQRQEQAAKLKQPIIGKKVN